jgi:hypothetical protein
MKSNHLAVLLSSAFFAAACGGATPATPTTPTGGEAGEHRHDGSGGEHHHDDSAQPAPVRAFHDVLAPLWHTDKGPDRVTKTCAQASTLKAKADATGDKELIAATTALAAECEKKDRPEFEARLVTVHERYHALAK